MKGSVSLVDLSDLISASDEMLNDGTVSDNVRSAGRHAFFEVVNKNMHLQDAFYIKTLAEQCVNFINKNYDI